MEIDVNLTRLHQKPRRIEERNTFESQNQISHCIRTWRKTLEKTITKKKDSTTFLLVVFLSRQQSESFLDQREDYNEARVQNEALIHKYIYIYILGMFICIFLSP